MDNKLGLFFVFFVVIFSFIVVLPNFLPEYLADIFMWRKISLGLDLQGGSEVLLSINLEELERERLVDLKKDIEKNIEEVKTNFSITIVSYPETRKTQKLLITPNEENNVHQNDYYEEIQVKLSNLLKRKNILIRKKISSSPKERDAVFEISLSEKGRDSIVQSALQESLEIVRRRVDNFGVNEPIIQRYGSSYIVIQLPGVEDPQRIKKLLGKTAKLGFHFVGKQQDINDDSYVEYKSSDGSGSYLVKKIAEVGGSNLLDASVEFKDGAPVVKVSFDTRGANLFARMTLNNIGSQIAIVLDDEVISAPLVRNHIINGVALIDGFSSTKEANDLVLLLRGGALPVPLEIVEEKQVGSILGKKSLYWGKLSSIIALVLVSIFMISIYRVMGVFSVIALFVNILIIFATLSLIGAVLTLPGIAGIILTIGMAVDSSVLIFERIKEESKKTNLLRKAIELGYKNVFSSIFDANITTFIVALVLFSYGSGLIKGFAVTLMIGIIGSMFTSIVMLKIMLSLYAKNIQLERKG